MAVHAIFSLPTLHIMYKLILIHFITYVFNDVLLFFWCLFFSFPSKHM